MRVLTVDDSEDSATFLGLALSLCDPTVEVRVRLSGESVTDEDCEWAEVALVDWMLPDTDGEEVIDRILSVNPDVRPFVLSAAGELARAGSSHPVLLKPLSVDEILAAVRG